MDATLAETVVLNLNDKRRSDAQVPIEVIIPEKPKSVPTPLVLLQHGSQRDAGKAFNSVVETDEHQKRLAVELLRNGFAVAIIDAFGDSGLKGNQKTEFPNAEEYAR